MLTPHSQFTTDVSILQETKANSAGTEHRHQYDHVCGVWRNWSLESGLQVEAVCMFSYTINIESPSDKFSRWGGVYNSESRGLDHADCTCLVCRPGDSLRQMSSQSTVDRAKMDSEVRFHARKTRTLYTHLCFVFCAFPSFRFVYHCMICFAVHVLDGRVGGGTSAAEERSWATAGRRSRVWRRTWGWWTPGRTETPVQPTATSHE